ncbi:MAG TPA: hypothetical protein VMI75_12955 [Polyangiaceae bacterium]|nr:hypothetical protein [Polyangiaceae bacterium]
MRWGTSTTLDAAPGSRSADATMDPSPHVTTRSPATMARVPPPGSVPQVRASAKRSGTRRAPWTIASAAPESPVSRSAAAGMVGTTASRAPTQPATSASRAVSEALGLTLGS